MWLIRSMQLDQIGAGTDNWWQIYKLLFLVGEVDKLSVSEERQILR